MRQSPPIASLSSRPERPEGLSVSLVGAGPGGSARTVARVGVLTAASGGRHGPSRSRPGDGPCAPSPGSGPACLRSVPACPVSGRAGSGPLCRQHAEGGPRAAAGHPAAGRATRPLGCTLGPIRSGARDPPPRSPSASAGPSRAPRPSPRPVSAVPRPWRLLRLC